MTLQVGLKAQFIPATFKLSSAVMNDVFAVGDTDAHDLPQHALDGRGSNTGTRPDSRGTQRPRRMRNESLAGGLRPREPSVVPSAAVQCNRSIFGG